MMRYWNNSKMDLRRHKSRGESRILVFFAGFSKVSEKKREEKRKKKIRKDFSARERVLTCSLVARQ